MAQRLDRELDTDIAQPHVPDGYTISPFNPETDQALQAGAQVDAFAGLPEADAWSLAVAARFVRWFEGREDLDLVAKAPDGTVAAMAIFLCDPVTRIGELEVVGTRAAYQRKGLSRAVLRTGLDYLKENGMNAVVVRTGTDNLPAIRLYESVGFCIVDRLYRYSK
jgi:mycothiol synthase